MDYPNKKDISFIDIYDDEVATYPRSVTYTGTVSTDLQDSKVLIADSDGDGFTTNFVEFGNNVAGFEEIRKGYYLFDGTEIRKVVGVTPSAQAITLDSPFTTSHEGLPLKVIKPILLPRVTFQNTGAVDGSIYTKTSPTDQTQYGSITLKAGDGYTFDSSTLSAFVIDSTNTTVKLSNAFFFEVGASGGGIAIGDSVADADAGSILYVDGSGNLTQDAFFTRTEAETFIENVIDLGMGEYLRSGFTSTAGIPKIESSYIISGTPQLSTEVVADPSEGEVRSLVNYVLTGITSGFKTKARASTIGDISGGNGTKITIDDINEQITIGNIKAYDDDAAAGTAGLTAGMVYMTTGSGAAPLNVSGILMIKQ